MTPTAAGMVFLKEEPGEADDLWLEPVVNRTSLVYDRLTYVVREPKIDDLFSYTYNHPSYYPTMAAIERMGGPAASLDDLCMDAYPARGKKPTDESAEGIPILKVRNVTGRGIDLDTEF